MKFMIKRWKKDYKRIILILIGLIIGILAISIGLSFFEDAISFSKENSGGGNKISELLIYSPSSNDSTELIKTLDKIVKDLNNDYKVVIGNVIYPLDRKIPMSDMPSINPVLYNNNVNWRPNLIYGRYLTLEETLSDKKIAVIGYELYKKVFTNQEFNGELTMNIYGQDYNVVGVIGRTKRYSPQNSIIQIPYKNYFDMYNEEPDINKIAISISGKDEFDISNYNYKELTLTDKPQYTNDIRIPLKLPMILGILILVVTVINESNLISLWILKRKKEIVIKKALGATNFIIIKEILIETLILSFISVIIALGIQYLVQIKLNEMLDNYELEVTFINFIISIIISIIIAICTSLIPTKIILSIHPSDELK